MCQKSPLGHRFGRRHGHHFFSCPRKKIPSPKQICSTKKSRRAFGASATLARRRLSNNKAKFESRTGQHVAAASAASNTERAIESGGRTAAERLLGAARQTGAALSARRKTKAGEKTPTTLPRETGFPNNPEVEGEEGSIRCLEDELQLERFRITRLERRVAVLQPKVDHLKKANATANKKVCKKCCVCCGLGVVFFSASLSLLYDICTCFFFMLSLLYIYICCLICVCVAPATPDCCLYCC